MDITGTANAIYFATRDNSAAVSQIRADFTSLALAIATDPAASQSVTSSTINGQTFTASGGITQGQRLQILRRVIIAYDRSAPLSRVAKPIV